MAKYIYLVLGGLSLNLVTPVEGADKPVPKERLSNAGAWVGKIKRVAEASDYMTVDFYQKFPYWQMYPSGYSGRRITQITLEWGTKTVITTKNVYLPDDMIVRVPKPPPMNAQGGVRAGPAPRDPNDKHPGLAGTHGDVSDLSSGQWVLIHLERNRDGHFFARRVFVLGEDTGR
jgi:hypothetical protein